MAFTQKQIDKYNRQKQINTLEKTTKNLFRMFRDDSMTAHKFTLRFEELMEKLQNSKEIRLDGEYHNELLKYIQRLYKQTAQNEDFDDTMLHNIKTAEMSNLNRLQKMKNNTSYKKDKHKQKNKDWN